MIGQLGACVPYGVCALSWLGENRKPVGAAIAVTWCTVGVLRYCKGYYHRAQLNRNRRAKQEAHRNALEALGRRVHLTGMSGEEMDNICSLTVSQLAQKLQSGELTSTDALHAYQKKALQVNHKTNALIDVVRDAETTAAACDQMVDRNERLLHGIPISIKDNFPMQGYDSVIGFSCNIDKPYSKDCVIVKVLRHQGAVPFVRTNVPQTMLAYDTANPIFGQTYNPHGEGRNPGGSSGGEAALVGGGGSPVGVGGDIGGSIRIPASFCGICGFKPTAGRVSTKDVNPVFKGQNVIVSAYGPMARDVDGLILMMRALLCQYHFDLDKTIPPLPFNEEVFTRKDKLRIGFYLEDDYMVPVPSMRRAVNISVQALKNKGYEVIPWKFPDMGKIGTNLWVAVLFADGGAELMGLLKHDAMDHAFSLMSKVLQLNKKLFKTIAYIIKLLYPRCGLSLFDLLGVGSVPAWQQLVRRVLKFRADVERDLQERKIDVLLCPAFTMTAPLVGQHRFCPGAASYTQLMNVLNFPAGTLPVTKVTAEDTAKMADYPLEDPWCKVIKKAMVGAEGLPVGVQLASLPWQEETCLRMMKELEAALPK